MFKLIKMSLIAALIELRHDMTHMRYIACSMENTDFISGLISHSDKYQARCLGSIDSR